MQLHTLVYSAREGQRGRERNIRSERDDMKEGRGEEILIMKLCCSRISPKILVG